ncbi:hypothetical protein PbB2_02827 [Candidatus Phycosocius bacilliformis]|uniref:Uncharacterized protein n=1 Tax=Candidatus Phycosocius bacilliformis TaxID=1445552 RepID=A0A2P2EDJ6_9PROT|nr:hypothetical protein PbB2_02827 [Candidatus Phycosocius bacilliformis]
MRLPTETACLFVDGFGVEIPLLWLEGTIVKNGDQVNQKVIDVLRESYNARMNLDHDASLANLSLIIAKANETS